MRSAGWNNNCGQALVLVIMIVSVLLVLTASLGTISGLTRDNIVGEQHLTLALYAADAGIEKTMAKTIAEVPSDPEWYNSLSGDTDTGILNGSLSNNTSFEVQARKASRSLGTSLLLKSAGKCLDNSGRVMAKKTVLADVVVFTAADYLRGICILPANPLPFNNTGMEIDMDGDFIIHGSLNSGAFTRLNGTVYASDTVFGSFPGGKHSNCPYIPPYPNLDSAFYLDKAMNDGQVYYTDATFTNPPAGPATYDGFYFIDGNVDLSGDYQGTAVFFVTGDINITGDLTPRQNPGDDADTTAGNLTLIALGDITLENSTVYGNLFSRGLVIRENAALYGAACVAMVDFNKGGLESGIFALNAGSVQLPQPDTVPVAVKIVEWQEIYPVF